MNITCLTAEQKKEAIRVCQVMSVKGLSGDTWLPNPSGGVTLPIGDPCQLAQLPVCSTLTRFSPTPVATPSSGGGTSSAGILALLAALAVGGGFLYYYRKKKG